MQEIVDLKAIKHKISKNFGNLCKFTKIIVIDGNLSLWVSLEKGFLIEKRIRNFLHAMNARYKQMYMIRYIFGLVFVPPSSIV